MLVRVFGDIDIAEDAVQEAFAAALARWPSEGLPPSPAGWIITTARNRPPTGCAGRRCALAGKRKPRGCIATAAPDTRPRRTPCPTTGSA